MHIVILTNIPFPIGLASTNRVISYAKGFAENNHKVTVLSLRPSEKKTSNTLLKGNYQGINFEYCTNTLVIPENIFKKYYIILIGLLTAIGKLLRLNRQKRINCFILVSNSAVNIIFFYLLARILKIKYIQEKSEYPPVLNNDSIFGKLFARFYINFLYKAFDGIFVMTNALREYFTDKVRKDAKIIIIPMTVETDRFINCIISKDNARNIVYCGDMTGNKDGVNILIQSFIIISTKYPDVKLILVGDGDQESMEKIRLLIEINRLERRIILAGRVNRDRIPEYLCSANILALARPSSLQSCGGFPTKLGEYLATGNPVVVTRVGEIPLFLKDGVNAFISEPDSAEFFATKLDYVLSNQKLAKKVGIEGRKTAISCFDYKVQSKRLMEYLTEICNSPKSRL